MYVLSNKDLYIRTCYSCCWKRKSNTNFLHYLFLKMNLGQYSDQSAQPGLAVNKLLKLKVALPIISEQTKIAKLLSLLDERIATQNKIIDKLQSLIKGLRVRLIQIENGNIVHLGEIARIYQPQTISSTELTEDGFLVYGANGIIAENGGYPPTQNGDIRSLFWLFSLMALQN